jgi:hypothetical protein
MHDHDQSIKILAAWVRSQHRRLSAALAGNHCHRSSVPEFHRMAADLQPLIDEITAADTVIDGAVLFISNVPVRIEAAIAAALANGATEGELKPLRDEVAVLKTKASALKTAMEANT